MVYSAPKVGSGEIGHDAPIHQPPSKLKTYGFALAIIVGIGGLVVGATGLAGYFHVGALSNMTQVNAFLMMAAGGGGIVFLIIGIVGTVKNLQKGSQQKPDDLTAHAEDSSPSFFEGKNKKSSQVEPEVKIELKKEPQKNPILKTPNNQNALNPAPTSPPATAQIFAGAKEILNAKPPLQQPLFIKYFGTEASEESAQKLLQIGDQEEGIQVLSALCPYFSSTHWNALTDNQFFAMDLVKTHTQLDGITKKQSFVTNILQNEKGYARLATLLVQKPDTFYALSPSLLGSHWKELLEFKRKTGDTQGLWIQAFDFSRFDKKTFNKMWPFILQNLPDLLPTFGAGVDGLKKIQDLKVHFGVRINWWVHLSSEQAIAISKNFAFFTEGFSEDEQKLVFQYLFLTDPPDQKNPEVKTKRLALLGTDPDGLKTIYCLSRFFEITHWKALTLSQAIALDFSLINEGQRWGAFNRLFGYEYEHLKDLNETEILTVAESFWKIKTSFSQSEIKKICSTFSQNRSTEIKAKLNKIFEVDATSI